MYGAVWLDLELLRSGQRESVDRCVKHRLVCRVAVGCGAARFGQVGHGLVRATS